MSVLNHNSQRVRACGAIVLLLSGWTCADISADRPSSTGLSTDDAQPSTIGVQVPNTDNKGDTNYLVNILPAEYQSGLAVRWQSDPNRCITRQNASPTLFDTVTMDLCKDTNEQAWILYRGKLMAAANLCVGARVAGDPLRMLPCADQNVSWFLFNGGPSYILPNAPLTYIAPEDSSGPLGGAIRLVSAADYDNSDSAKWHLTGVGNRKGSLIAWESVPGLCMTLSPNLLALSSCDASDHNQRWSLYRGDLSSDSNMCIVSADSTPSAQLIACSEVSNTADKNQGFAAQEVLRYYTMFDGQIYQIGVTTGNQTIQFQPASPSNIRSHFVWGTTVLPGSPRPK